MLVDQPSEIIWCIVSKRTYVSLPSLSNVTRRSGPRAKLKGAISLMQSKLPNVALTHMRSQLCQINKRKQKNSWWRNYLNGLFCLNLEGCTQGFMSSHHLLQAAFQRLQVHLSAQAYCDGNTVSGIFRLQLSQKQEPSLRKGER